MCGDARFERLASSEACSYIYTVSWYIPGEEQRKGGRNEQLEARVLVAVAFVYV